MNNEYKSVCDKCGRKTWYKGGGQCQCTYPQKKTCKTCGRSEEVHPYREIRCAGTLRPIDNSGLNPVFTTYYHTGERVEVAFCNENGKQYEAKRGTISKTTGWKPVYILMLTKGSISSSWCIGPNDKLLQAFHRRVA